MQRWFCKTREVWRFSLQWFVTHQDFASLFQNEGITWRRRQSHAVHEAHVSTATLQEVGEHFEAFVWQQNVHTAVRHVVEAALEVDDGGTGHGAGVGSGSTYEHRDTWEVGGTTRRPVSIRNIS